MIKTKNIQYGKQYRCYQGMTCYCLVLRKDLFKEKRLTVHVRNRLMHVPFFDSDAEKDTKCILVFRDDILSWKIYYE